MALLCGLLVYLLDEAEHGSVEDGVPRVRLL